MKIINIVQNTNIEDHKKILQSIILSAITEINNEGRMTPEVKNNLIENLDGFFAADSDNKRIDYLYKLSAELVLHEDEANQQEIYIALRDITGLNPIPQLPPQA